MKPMIPLALAAVAAPAAAQMAAIPVAPVTGTLLDVSAEGQVTRVPDVAVINAGVVSQAVDAASAMRDTAARIDRVVAALRSSGVADRDIRTAQVSLSPQYRYKEGEAPTIIGYQASNSVTLRFRAIERAGAILDTLVREGANQINGPTLTIDQPDAAMDEARVAAMRAARTRADLYAKAAGLRVKRIVAITESGGFQPPPPVPMMMMRADAAEAATKIMPGEQQLSMTVNVRFELE